MKEMGDCIRHSMKARDSIIGSHKEAKGREISIFFLGSSRATGRLGLPHATIKGRSHADTGSWAGPTGQTEPYRCDAESCQLVPSSERFCVRCNVQVDNE